MPLPEIGGRAGALNSPGGAAGLVAGAVAVLVGVRLARHGLDTSAFVVAGDRWATPGHVPAELAVRPHSQGYDGQFVYRLGLDPLTRQRVAHGIALDNPAYRQQRIGLPLLSRLVDLATPVGLASALLAVNCAAVVATAWAAAKLLVRAGRNALGGAALALAPALTIGLARDLTEPMAWAALLVGLGLWLDRRWWAAGACFVVAALTRETSLAVLVGIGLWQLLRARRPRLPGLAPLLVAAAAAASWEVWLEHVWGVLPLRAGQDNLGKPVLGVLHDIGAGLVRPTGDYTGALSVGLTWEAERLLTVGVLVAGLLALRRTVLPEPLRWGWATAAVLAVSLGGWTYDVQFLRATHEAFGMSLLVLLTVRPVRGERVRPALLVAVAGVSAYVAGAFALAL
jgi:hypothetical protein